MNFMTNINQPLKSPIKEEFRGMTLSLILILLVSLPIVTYAQDQTRTIERSAQFTNPNNEDNELKVYNINGSVTVTGYDGTEVEVVAIEEIDGSKEEIALAREELSLRVEEEGNRILIYLDAPFITLKRKNNRIHYRIDRWDDDYEFLYDITIRVPANTHIYASTINRGKVTIENTRQRVTACNVNGALELKDISGSTKANTVNGDITASYVQSPAEDSEYQTVNGTIEVNYPDDLSADIRFKSLHGELYTDFSNIERLQPRVATNTESNRGRTRYRLDRFAPIRIADGGPTFNFEVLNGDVYIKRIQL